MFEQVRAISDWQSLNIYEMIKKIGKKIFYIVINSFQPQKLLGPYCHTVSRQSSFEIIWKVMFILSFKNTPLK